MNALLDSLELARTSRHIAPAAKLDIRHLVFDMCSSHDLKANGVYHVARRLAAEQIAAGQDARIIFLREEDRQMPSEPSDVPMQVLELAGRKVLGRRVSINGDILRAMTAGAGRTTVFHIHAARQPLLLPIIVRLRRLGIPYAMTIHGRYAHVFDRDNHVVRRVPALYLQTIERRVLEGALFVQGVSPAECDTIRRIAPRARVELVPNAAYSSRFDGVPRAREGATPSPRFPVFGYLGRYEIEHKGLDLLVAGFAAYRKAGGKGVLELVGTGPAREEIATQARTLGIAECVNIDGPRFGAEKVRTFTTWDYFVMPSRFEGVPIGALEAALAGLPLIVSAETGLREHVASFECGVGIAELTAEAVAQSFAQAERATAQRWSCMSAAAYRMALSVGDWTSTAAQLVTLYRSGL